jgi:hypothetical protein
MTPSPAANPRPSKALTYALWANAAFLALIAVALLTRDGAPSFLPAAHAQNQQPIAGGAGVFIMPAQMQANVWGCYLLDVDNKTICAYQFFPGEKMLRFAAARTYRNDTKLQDFNTNPSPREIKNLIDKQQNANAAGGGGDVPAANSEKPSSDK